MGPINTRIDEIHYGGLIVLIIANILALYTFVSAY